MGLVLIFVLVGLFFLVLGSKFRSMEEESQMNKMYEAHQRLGFPKFTKEQQLKMLVDQNFGPIQDLDHRFQKTPVGGKLVRKYIGVSQIELRKYLVTVDFLKARKEEGKRHPKRDGFWIKDDRIVSRDRGVETPIYSNLTESEMIKFFSKQLWQIVEKK